MLLTYFINQSIAVQAWEQTFAGLGHRRITSELLTILTKKEINEVEAYWRIVLGLD